MKHLTLKEWEYKFYANEYYQYNIQEFIGDILKEISLKINEEGNQELNRYYNDGCDELCFNYAMGLKRAVEIIDKMK